MKNAMNAAKIKKVLNYLDTQRKLPEHIRQGDCIRDNAHIVNIKNGIVVHEETTYFYNWGYSYSKPGDGISQVYLTHVKIPPIIKPLGIYTELNAKNKFFRDIFGDTMPVFSVRANINTTPYFIPTVDELYVYNYSNNNGVDFEYTQSGRDGLEMGIIQIQNRYDFLHNSIFPQADGIRVPLILLTKKFEKHLLFDTTMIKEINKWLMESTYHIEDDDEYGEYRLKFISYMNCEGLNSIIEKHWRTFNGEKYIKELL